MANYPHYWQFSSQPRALAVVGSTTPMQVDQNEASVDARDEMRNGGLSQAKSIIQSSEVVLVLNLILKCFSSNLKNSNLFLYGSFPQ